MSPKTKEQNEIIRQQSIEAIKQAALSLFAHKGYGNTSISSIAKEAGVSKGLMYNYFTSKEALLLAIIEDASQVGAHLMQDIANENMPPKERLAILIEGTFDWVLSHLSYYKLLASLAFQEDALSAMGDFAKQKVQGQMQLGEQLFEAMGYKDPEIAALEFGALLEGIFLQFIVMGNDYPLKKMKAFLLKKYVL